MRGSEKGVSDIVDPDLMWYKWYKLSLQR